MLYSSYSEALSKVNVQLIGFKLQHEIHTAHGRRREYIRNCKAARRFARRVRFRRCAYVKSVILDPPSACLFVRMRVSNMLYIFFLFLLPAQLCPFKTNYRVQRRHAQPPFPLRMRCPSYTRKSSDRNSQTGPAKKARKACRPDRSRSVF